MASLRYRVVGRALELASKFHIQVSRNIFGRQYQVPVRGNLALYFLLRRSSHRTWKSYVFENFDFGPGTCFIDVGVNIGQTLLEFKARKPNVAWYGYEPNPNCVYYVNELITANRLTDCSVQSFGLSNKVGAFTLFLAEGQQSATGATMDGGKFLDAVPIQVAALPFDLVSEKLPIPALFKIDVEGHESEVLAGMKDVIEVHRPVIICEILSPGHDSKNPAADFAKNDELIHEIHSWNYDVYQIIKETELTTIPKFELIKIFHRMAYEDAPEMCDFILVPQEKSYKIMKRLFGVNGSLRFNNA